MNEMNEIKLPKGVDRIAVKQHDDRIVIEFIPKEAKFKEGDFVYEDGRIMIVKSYPNMYHANVYPEYSDNVGYNSQYGLDFSSPTFRHATEEEKKVLIDAMRKDGKRWNAEKKCIEDIPQPVEDIPQPVKELKKGDLAIFWQFDKTQAVVRLFDNEHGDVFQTPFYVDNAGHWWANAIKFESKEQFEKVLRGEI